MGDTARVPRRPDGDGAARRPLIDEQLADELLGKAQAGGVKLLGPDGLLSQVTKAVLERALAEEMTGHLGYGKRDPAGRGSGNNRNGTTAKSVLTEVGAVDLAVPRDRNGTFEPQIVRKGQTAGLGELGRLPPRGPGACPWLTATPGTAEAPGPGIQAASRPPRPKS